jgi:hypothetical protein
MTSVRVPRGWRSAVALLVLAAAGAGMARAANPNERLVHPAPNVLDRDELNVAGSKVWAFEFRFKDPRLITVDVPGRGRKVCWYMWYQVINRTGEPHTIIPDFELVTLDQNSVHRDQILPKVQEAIRQVEDPTDYEKIKNSVTIAAEPIPPSKPNATPTVVTGVAIWDDVNPDTTRFSVFVSGLSNGWSVTDPIPPDTQPVVRRKTLQLNFKRLGDRYYQDSHEIQFVEPAQWVYRGTRLKVPGLPEMEKGVKPEKQDKPEKPAVKPKG